MVMEYKVAGVDIREEKFISANDVVSIMPGVTTPYLTPNLTPTPHFPLKPR